MTAVYSRAPLQVLDMASTQRQSRRKTTRHLFVDDDEEPPAKRSRVESVSTANGVAKAAPAKGNAAKAKKSRAAYDEDADGFMFTRKTRSKKASEEPVPVKEPQTSTSKLRAAPRSKPHPEKTDSLLGSTSSEAEVGQRRRRSARLSGDKEEVVQILPAEKPKRKRKSSELQTSETNRDASPAPAQNELQVEKKREGTKIALPFADTPVINRNKEMRAGKNKSQNRRSSVQSRGRRASSLIESGTSNAVPHADVGIADFYKHIEHSLIEPKRMKQLLTWSATRALPEKAHGGNGSSSEIFTIEASRQIIEDLLKDFANRPDMSDWFSREDTAETTGVGIVKKPNPRNAQNATRLQQLESDIARLKEEEKSWQELMATPKGDKFADVEDIDTEALDPAQAEILATLKPLGQESMASRSGRKSRTAPNAVPNELGDISARLQAINANLEPTIDYFADGIHKMSQYRLAAERVADRLLGTTARQLEVREKEARDATGTSAVEGRDVLSALAGALNSRGEGR